MMHAKARLIDQDFWAIEEDKVRMFLLQGTDYSLLIDTGMGGGDLLTIVKELTPLPLKVAATHADRDHIGGCAPFAELYLHPGDHALCQKRQPHLRTLALPERFDLGNRVLEIIHVPGHTPGSVALYERAKKRLIAGDTISAGPIYLFGEGRRLDTYIQSLAYLNERKNDFDVILPSHYRSPLGGDQLTALLAGARKLRRGELSGTTAGAPSPDCKKYRYRKAFFFF